MSILMMDEYENFARLCRTCLNTPTEANDLRSLFKTGKLCGQLTKLSALLSDFTSLHIDIDDGLPGNICSKCIIQVSRSFNFKQQAIKNAETLNEKLEDIKKKYQQLLVEEKETELKMIAEQQKLLEEERLRQNLIEEQRRQDQQIKLMEEQQMKLLNEQQQANLMKEQQLQLEFAQQKLPTQYYIQGTDEHLVEEDEEEMEVDDDDEQVDTESLKQSETCVEVNSEEAESSQSSTKPVTRYSGMVKIESNISATPAQQLIVDSNPPSYKIVTVEPQDAQTQEPKVVFRAFERKTKKFPLSFECQICLKVLSNNSSFKYHMQLHSEKTPFLCQECGAGFKTKNAYEGHMVTHQENPPNTCDICKKSYRQAASLRSHMTAVHSGILPFICQICGKGCTQKSGYKKHMLTHTGEKPYNCDFCGRNFRYSSNLIIHKRSHTGQKPYHCGVCEKKFPGSEQLKRHLLVHTGERPFECDYYNCGKKFNRASSLKVHQNLHTGVKNYQCPICSKSYIQAHCLKTHIANNHKGYEITEAVEETDHIDEIITM